MENGTPHDDAVIWKIDRPRKKGTNKWFLVFTVIIVIALFSAAYFLLWNKSGVEVKVFYDGDWEGGMWVHSPESLNGTGDKVFSFSMPDTSVKDWVSAWFMKADNSNNELRMEIWINGRLEYSESTTDAYGMVDGLVGLP